MHNVAPLMNTSKMRPSAAVKPNEVVSAWRSPSPTSFRTPMRTERATMSRWPPITPFGTPVEPDVNSTRPGWSSGISTLGVVGAVAVDLVEHDDLVVADQVASDLDVFAGGDHELGVARVDQTVEALRGFAGVDRRADEPGVEHPADGDDRRDAVTAQRARWAWPGSGSRSRNAFATWLERATTSA